MGATSTQREWNIAAAGRQPDRGVTLSGLLAARDLARTAAHMAAKQSSELNMADPLYLNLWFPSFEVQDMLPRALMVMRQFPFSAQQPGISYLALHPISWDEATILERRFQPGATPEEAVAIASDLLHEDYAYLFEAHWDLWAPGQGTQPWSEQPQQVKFLVHGLEFDEETYRENGHIQVDFGLDTLFLGEDAALSPFVEQRIRANVQKLVEFTNKVEKNCGISGRVLWSESEENLAQKLLSRLQKVQ